jgi:hypothetical protein
MAEKPVDITDIVTELAALRETAALMREKLAKAEEQIADLRQDRDQRREARRGTTLPSRTIPETAAPTPWWRWLRTTGCLAGASLLLALSMPAGAQPQQPQPQPQRECFTVVAANNPGAVLNLGAILLDRCTGKTSLGRVSRAGGGYIIRSRRGVARSEKGSLAAGDRMSGNRR